MKLSDTSVKIYVVKRNGTTQVELVELTGNVIPAATAVILQADGAKSLTLEATDEAGDKEKAADNLLKGNGYSTKAAAGKSTYALAFNPAENKVQFGLVENGVAIPAFKGHIELGNAAGATAHLFIALPTAVESAKAQNTKAGTTYDLTGRRDNRPPRDKFTSATVRNSFSNKTHPTYESLYLSQSSKSSAQR